MKLQGAENGKILPYSEPFRVFVADGDEVRPVMARFRVVSPRIETLCRALAEFYLRTALSRQPSESLIVDEQNLLMMSHSLRHDVGDFKAHVFPFPVVLDKDGISLLERDQALFYAVRDCEIHKNLITSPVELWADYQTYLRNEYPLVATDNQLAELLEDAKKKPLLTLLLERGFSTTVRLARGLATQIAASGAGSGSGGSPSSP